MEVKEFEIKTTIKCDLQIEVDKVKEIIKQLAELDLKELDIKCVNKEYKI